MSINLTKFCGSIDEPREYMRTPFARGQFIYATNGHICVRITKPEGDATPETDKIPKVEPLFERSIPNGKARHTKLKLPKGEPCYACGGSGVRYQCDECDGKGEITHGRHDYSCKECEGDGQVSGSNLDLPKETCNVCYGYGIGRYTAVKVGKAHYDLRYLLRIVDLPGLQFFPGSAVQEDANTAKAAYFKFDGGEGLLMPTRQ